MSITYADESTMTFHTYPEMQHHHEQLSTNSQWIRCGINSLKVVPLTSTSPLLSTPGSFASGVSDDAAKDTANHIQLALSICGQLYPLRDTAYKSLLDRAKISGTALNHLTKEELASILNMCLSKFRSEALVLIRDEKITAVHSGDRRDYSVLPIDSLLLSLTGKLDSRFSGGQFVDGFRSHAISSASWTLPANRDELLGTYSKMLTADGKKRMADRLMPGIRFVTSDTGVASAKVYALIMGTQYPMQIGSCVSVEHRRETTVANFDKALDQLFAQFTDSVQKLQNLMSIHLDYPVNTMTRICKKLSLPKKAALEAISMFEVTIGDEPATAHDVFLALQEVLFNLKTQGASESKLLSVEESLARALTLRWSDYDLAKAVSY
ncbi:MAG: hypothetical protein MJ077_08025 [Oscillospiraceae bacterium]|nr:hypothetical protein [Oscillospiraceae bacterium]